MTNIMQRLFGNKPAGYEQAAGVNHEGFPTFERDLRERYVQVLLTNTLSHTFYASQGDNYAQTLTAHGAMIAADPAFAAKAIVYAREQGTMRTQPIIGLVALSLADLGLFRQVFGRVIQTPGDLIDFVQIVRSKQIRAGMGRSIKDAVNGWLNGLSEYHAIKYGADTAGKFSLRDVLRLTHPQPADERADALFSYLADRDAWRDKFGERIPGLLPQIHQLELLKRAEEPAEQRALIEAGRLPYEIVTGAIKPDRETWGYLMRQMPYMALLRHLVTLQRAEILADPAAAAYVAERLGNAEAMRKAKILPFRLHAAWVMFEPKAEAELMVKAALEQALEQAFVNLPALPGRVVVSPDVSGSMGGSINYPSKVRYIDIAGIFGGALMKASPNASLLPFDTAVREVELTPGEPVMSVTAKIAKLCGGGTAISAPISLLLERREPVDVFIGITDSEEWARDGYGGHGFLPQWRAYREQVAPNAQAFLITIAPYGHAVAPQAEPGVHYIYGWADHVPAYIARTLAGYASQIAAIE
ncbi:MAG TPA: TROVE domain-containing protein, partial [Herpetosiphonaceae bacterium]